MNENAQGRIFKINNAFCFLLTMLHYTSAAGRGRGSNLYKGEVMNDVHDGDRKVITVKARSEAVDIKPYGSKESWDVKSKFDADCVARVNFDVPGKPAPVRLSSPP